MDQDKYYTPLAVAAKALESAKLPSAPVICADTACGAGSLLSAAQQVLRAQYCIGIDSDRETIKQLRLQKPDWKLYVGDLLRRHRAPSTDFVGANNGVDLLVLNPPFSLGPRKFLTVKYRGDHVKCSVAMAHLLRSMELFKPNHGVVAVVPESLLHSATDKHARELLEGKYSISELLQLSIYTFKGARVNSVFVQIGCARSRSLASNHISQYFPVSVQVVRGGMQMHSFARVKSGVKVIHSTALKSIARGGFSQVAERTSTSAKGRTKGWMILLPRVGVPNEHSCRAVYSREEVQLSDCVIAIMFGSKHDARIAEIRMLAAWSSLVNLYKGTGARYVTIERMSDWLLEIGLHDGRALADMSLIQDGRKGS